MYCVGVGARNIPVNKTDKVWDSHNTRYKEAVQELYNRHFFIWESDWAGNCGFSSCEKSAKASRNKQHLRKALTPKEKPVMKRGRVKDFLGRENSNSCDPDVEENVSHEENK